MTSLVPTEPGGCSTPDSLSSKSVGFKVCVDVSEASRVCGGVGNITSAPLTSCPWFP